MRTSEFIQKFRSKFLWGNILAMAAVVLLLIVGVVVGLDFYTHHGEKIVIPDVRHHSYENAERVLERLGFKVEVVDTGYVKTLAPGVILEQTPEGGKSAKAGRIVYLTINALDTPTLTIPDLIDNSSLREAQAKLTSMGFKLGEPQKVLGEKDWVYGIKCGGRNLTAGDRVSVESVLIIQVGNGQRDTEDSTLYIDDYTHDYPEVGDIFESQEDGFEIVE